MSDRDSQSTLPASNQQDWSKRYQVVKDSFWWRVKTGDGTRLAGKFHTEKAAQQMTAEMLTAFLDGKFVGEQAFAAHTEHVRKFLEELGPYLGLEDGTVKPTDFIEAAKRIRQWCEDHQGSGVETASDVWRPVGTEPRDTVILCWWPPVAKNGPPACGTAVHSKYGDGWHKPGGVFDGLRTPTHWRPMPTPPGASAVKTPPDEGWREHPDGTVTVADITLRPASTRPAPLIGGCQRCLRTFEECECACTCPLHGFADPNCPKHAVSEGS